MKIFGQFLVGQQNSNSPLGHQGEFLRREAVWQSENIQNKSGEKSGKYFLDARNRSLRRISREDFF